MISLPAIKPLMLSAFTIAILLLLSCEKKTDCCAVVQMHVDLDVRNKSGISVFDPAVLGHLTMDSIQVYYLKNGKYELFRNAGYDAVNGFLFLQTTGQPPLNILRIMVSSFTDQQNESRTLIKYGNLKSDTIRAQLKKSVIEKLWINELSVPVAGKPLIRVIK